MNPTRPPEDDVDAWNDGLDGHGDPDRAVTRHAQRIRRHILAEIAEDIQAMDEERLLRLERVTLAEVMRIDSERVAAELGARILKPSRWWSRSGSTDSGARRARGPRSFGWNFPIGAAAGSAFTLIVGSLLLNAPQMTRQEKGISPTSSHLQGSAMPPYTIETPVPQSIAEELTAILLGDSVAFQVAPAEAGIAITVAIPDSVPSLTRKWLSDHGVPVTPNSHILIVIAKAGDVPATPR